MARLIEGEVVYGLPVYEERTECNRCGRRPRGWAWWAPMTRPDEQTLLGYACPDCHA